MINELEPLMTSWIAEVSVENVEDENRAVDGIGTAGIAEGEASPSLS